MCDSVLKGVRLHGLQHSTQGLTFGTQFFSPLVNQRLAPAANRIHDLHLILCFGGEACDGLAFDDRVAGFWVDHARVDCLSVAPVEMS